MIIFLVVVSILIVAIFVVSSILIVKINKETVDKTKEAIQDILDLKCFSPKRIVIINKHLILAINKNSSKLAIIENFNPNNPEFYNYSEILTSLITKIEKSGVHINIKYTKQGDEQVLSIHPVNKINKDFVHKLYRGVYVKKLQEKYPDYNFSITGSSDWECSYVWAYNPLRTQFAYYKTTDKQAVYKLNLRKEHFTIDTKYKYFEAPVLGIPQQLFVYNADFLDELFISLFQTIKHRATNVADGTIYYDSYNNIIYLSNGSSSLQSVILNKVEEVCYKENRIYFNLLDDEKTISFIANQQLMKDFDEFVTNYNLRKIANSFDYQTDKLINATENTKFIIDTSRDRVVYCAGLNTFSKFNYLTISFSNLEDAVVEKSNNKSFVRIYTKDKDILDVSCKKPEVAQYIMAQIKILING